MFKRSLLLITLLVGCSYSRFSTSLKPKYVERLNEDPACKDESLKAVRAGHFEKKDKQYQVQVDYCYNTTKGQVEGVKVYLGDNKMYEKEDQWGSSVGFSDSIEGDFQYFMSYFTIDQEMTKFMNGKEGVPNFELTGIIDVETIWNTFFAREETIKIWGLLKQDISKYSDGKSSVVMKFRFSGRPYTLTNNKGEHLQLFTKMPDKFPIPDSFFVTVEEGSNKFEFVVLNDPEKALYSAFKFDNCKKIDWLKVNDDSDSSKVLRCK